MGTVFCITLRPRSRMMMKYFRRPSLLTFSAVVMLISLWPCAVRAGEGSPQFPARTWEVEAYGSYIQPIRFSEDRFSLGTVGVAYYPLDNFSLGISVSGYHVNRV